MSRPAFDHSPLLQATTDLAVEVYAITETSAFDGRDSLRSQVKGAALSVSDTIAEGLERETKNGLRSFLFVARSSAGEVRSVLRSLEDDPEFAAIQPEIISLRSKAEAISKQLGQWSRMLRKSDRTTQPAAGAQTRKALLAARRGREFLYELDQMRTAAGGANSRSGRQGKNPESGQTGQA
jgi:four helix bundle protein